MDFRTSDWTMMSNFCQNHLAANISQSLKNFCCLRIAVESSYNIPWLKQYNHYNEVQNFPIAEF